VTGSRSRAWSRSATVSGRSWVRLATDLPTGRVEIVSRRTGRRDYLYTLRRPETEAVFARDDCSPVSSS
jgi:hypothetical protein